MLKVLDIPNLFELVRRASDAALFCQAIAASLRYPPVDGQREVLANMADIAAHLTATMYSQLSLSLEVQGQQAEGVAAPPLDRTT